VRENRIKSAFAGFELPAEGALSAGLQATNIAEGGDSGQLLSSDAGSEMSEDNKAVLRESKNELSNCQEAGKLRTMEESLRLLREANKASLEKLSQMILRMPGRAVRIMCAPQETIREAPCQRKKYCTFQKRCAPPRRQSGRRPAHEEEALRIPEALCAPQETIREAPCTEEEALRIPEVLCAPQETIREAPCTEEEALCAPQETIRDAPCTGEEALRIPEAQRKKRYAPHKEQLWRRCAQRCAPREKRPRSAGRAE
jgi:hypothetical protein